MAHNLDFTTGDAAIAFMGDRNDIWHRFGQQMQKGMSIEQWAENAKLAWQAVKVPLVVALEGDRFEHIEASKRFAPYPDRFATVRSDNGAPLGIVSDVYQIVQPLDVLEWFDRFIQVDDRFQLDVAGALDGGRRIWATATFNGGISIGGDNHKARLLMSTTLDGTGSTSNQMCVTRVVCQNTYNVASREKGAVVRTRHNTQFDAAAVAKELAVMAQGVVKYKEVGDALAQVEMAKQDVSTLFKQILDIPLEAKAEEVSTRKQNQFKSLSDALRETKRERNTDKIDAFAALQAITRYVDHDRGSDPMTRFENAQFGSGATLKGKAMDLLMPRIADKVPVLAS